MSDDKKYWHDKGEQDASEGKNESPHGGPIQQIFEKGVFNIATGATDESIKDDKDAYEQGQKNYRDQKDDDSGGGLCYLTTACTESMGLSDDCQELSVLRKFRDEVLLNTEAGRKIVEEYYKIAPRIVEAVNQERERKAIWSVVYEKIKNVIELITMKKSSSAIDYYKEMTIELKKKYL